jgi:aquaporin Z
MRRKNARLGWAGTELDDHRCNCALLAHSEAPGHEVYSPHEPMAQGTGHTANLRFARLRVLNSHWPEYLIEAWGTAMLLWVSAMVAGWVEPRFRASWPALAWRGLEAIATALTIVIIVYSPWGRRSGAHFNPALTVTFLALKRIAVWDAVLYSAFQVVGAFIGLLLAGFILGAALREPPVLWIVTQPGRYGIWAALFAEFAVSFIFMRTILWMGGRPAMMRLTGVFAGALAFLCVCFEAPISRFSINPARSFASAAASGQWAAFWIYLIAPPTGMLAAAWIARLQPSTPMLRCAKLVHSNSERCIHCGYVPNEHSR